MIAHDEKRSGLLVAALAGLSLLLTACGGGSSSSSDGGGSSSSSSGGSGDSFTSVQIDATAGGFGAPADDPANTFTFFNFDTGAVVENPTLRGGLMDDWHIAFKRTNIKLNGGVSGPGVVTGSVADSQDEYYDTSGDPDSSVFLNASASLEVGSLDAVTDTSALTFESDKDNPAVVGDGGDESWYAYDFMTHVVSANTDIWNIARGAAGSSFAKFHVTNIVQATREITLELFVQGSVDVAFSMTPVSWTASIGAGGGALCYDFDTTAEVDCTSAAADWDLQVEVSADGRGWYIWTNGGVRGDGSSGAAFGPLDSGAAMAFVSGASVPNYFSDTQSGVFKSSSWYAYNLTGSHRLWPNYRVYVIDTGSIQYKMQITSYYNNAGTSGYYSIRYAPVE
ncbi:MAG: HmuY family protein [Pseudomonadota bacterium]